MYSPFVCQQCAELLSGNRQTAGAAIGFDAFLHMLSSAASQHCCLFTQWQYGIEPVSLRHYAA